MNAYSRSILLFPLTFLILCGAAPDSAPSTDPLYVAVGYGGRRMSSRDGIHWEHVQHWAVDGGDDANNLISVAFGKGKFVAVGGAFPGRILVSTDGAEWREVKQMKFRVHPVLFAPDLAGGRFVAGGPGRQLFWSEDGETWHDGPNINVKLDPDWAFWFRSGAYGNKTFLFRGNGGNGQKTQWFATTHDGEHIDATGADLPANTSGPAFGADAFVMIAPGGVCLKSADGRTWAKSNIPGGENLRQVIWTGRRFFATGDGPAFASPDAITWTRVADRVPCEPLYADEDRHIFIGSSWPGTMWSSPDGITWTKGDPLPKDGINAVTAGTPSKP